MTRRKKFSRLKKIIADMGSVLVAFSGGVDSSFLLKVAACVLPKDKVMAVTADSLTYPTGELASAKKFCARLRIKHKIIRTNELKDEDFSVNHRQRCYFCKRELFGRLKKTAVIHGLNYICDAGNVSDRTDFRPGRRAIKELSVRSPLEEAGLNKADIRALSRGLGMSCWNKPAAACLASRIPYNTRITPDLLRRIDRGELALRKLGFDQVRLRHQGQLARIEVDKIDIPRLVKKRRIIIDKIKGLGYNYVTVDLEGYRTGSMNHER